VLGFDESQQADIFFIVQKLMEQTVAIISRRSAVPGRKLCLWRLTAGQKAGGQ
jgi:hypothetical protein